MSIVIRPYTSADVSQAAAIWNEVVEDGIAFPQLDELDEKTGDLFFQSQSYTGLAVDEETGEILGLYILHPNNIGRVGHICNCSYAVKKLARGRQVGKQLISDSLAKGRELGFKIMQFNAVVKTNWNARHLYEKLGFEIVGTIKGGFLMKDGHYEDIILYAYYL